ncbi:hypothetical protein ABOM_009798 [Aspergillus bombycis]|uniref:Uncharacterized protein n=1 Tax=Aspergillus bombycis TaxID=109264 RepID=A0A1F7ZR27_9EURO|nr:hypothetical protein ABOM_009798 [Aspergillus bombycis]OGM41903.1 hypothetical protein ABOM_009798 [Aspergillus bombycis]
MLTSSSSDSSSCSNSPISQHPHPQAYFPSLPRRREPVKCPRYYSTPLRSDSPESTPLQMYGLEQREPSLYGDRPSTLLRRFSHALDDIKEDFSLQLDPRNTTEKIRSKRRQSTLMLDTSAPGSRAGSLSGSESVAEVPRARPMSMMSTDNSFIPPTRRLSRRLTLLGFRKNRLRGGQAASISQPNLIGSSTQM